SVSPVAPNSARAIARQNTVAGGLLPEQAGSVRMGVAAGQQLAGMVERDPHTRGVARSDQSRRGGSGVAIRNSLSARSAGARRLGADPLQQLPGRSGWKSAA